MTRSRQADQWNHTACLLTMLANVHRDPKKNRAFKPSDFTPFPAPEAPPPKVDLSVLKSVFVDGKA